MHTAYMPPAEETWHMKWCVKYIFVTISVAHLCHGVTCAITRCSGMSYEQNDSLWSENVHLLSHICYLNLLVLLVLWTIICAILLFNLSDCNSLLGRCLWNTKEWHKNSVNTYDPFYKSHVTECAAEANLKLKLFIRAKSYNVLGS